MKKHILFFVGSFVVFLSSCKYDNFKEIKPTNPTNSGCDTVGVMSYATDVVPILTPNCTASCHKSGGSATNLVGHAATTSAYPLGNLHAAIAHLGGGVQNMPQGGSKLSDCDIAKIKKWIDAGAPNN